MASSKVMKSSASRNSDLSRRSSSTKPQQQLSDHNNNKNEACSGLITSSAMTVDGILRNVYNAATTTPSSAADAQISLIDTAANNASLLPSTSKTVDDVWREIVSGDSHKKEMKEEAPDEMMTLEDFLVKAGAVDDVVGDMDDADVKAVPIPLTDDHVYAFDPPPPPPQVDGGGGASIMDFGNGVDHRASGGRGKRGRVMLEPLDKAAQQRQRRMIKNRESAARSRERKQAYQVELESLAVRLEEENELLIKEKAERTKERYKQLMEKVIPVVEKQRPPRVLRRVNSMQW